jgi:hypothetical protein
LLGEGAASIWSSIVLEIVALLLKDEELFSAVKAADKLQVKSWRNLFKLF